jgi:hypothetical protein
MRHACVANFYFWHIRKQDSRERNDSTEGLSMSLIRLEFFENPAVAVLSHLPRYLLSLVEDCDLPLGAP